MACRYHKVAFNPEVIRDNNLKHSQDKRRHVEDHDSDAAAEAVQQLEPKVNQGE